MGGESVTSSRSQRSVRSSSGASVRSQRSTRSSASSKGGTSMLEDGLEKIARKDSLSYSNDSNGNGPPSVRSGRSSVRSGRSTASAASNSSRRSSASNRSSSKNNNGSSNGNGYLDSKLERIAEKSVLNESTVTTGGSSTSSWRSPYQGSSTSVSSRRSAASAASRSSRVSSSEASRSSRSSKTSKTSTTVPASNVHRSDHSVASHNTSVSSKSGNFSARGQQAEGVDYLEAGNYAKAVLLFTEAVQAYRGREGASEQSLNEALGTVYAYRAEALYELGAYEASVGDARNALECERLSRSQVGDHPYDHNQSSYWSALHPEKGRVLRAKALCSLGHSLLALGKVEGVKDAFNESIDVAKRALEDAEDLSAGEQKKSTIERAVHSAKVSTSNATAGLSHLSKYEGLKRKLETGGYKSKDYLNVLDEALEIAPMAMELHVDKVRYLVGKRRWFSVANHCEHVAARAVKWDGLLRGDLAELDPYPGIPRALELDANFFDRDSGNSVPHHLRVPGTKATRDAAFRLPNQLLGYYLRALRLEERYKAAVLVGTALAEFDSQGSKSNGTDNHAENKRFHSEWDKLDRTIKLKEEGDALFRDAYYDRAVTLYGECLEIDGNDELFRNGSILRQASSWPVACTKANDAGGKLHAVLHSNRAACFASMGRHDDAIKESSHAIHIHSMYTKAILRRARCYAKTGQDDRAKADFDRYIVLVEGAREFPYPPPYQGSACYFDMPSGVTAQQLDGVRMEMNDLGIRPVQTRGNVGGESKWGWGKFISMPSFGLLESMCCKSAKSQVVTAQQPSHWPTDNDPARSRAGGDGRRVSWSNGKAEEEGTSTGPPPRAFTPDPSNTTNPLIKSRDLYDHPLEPPSVYDTSVDYYAILGLGRSASESEIKQAYHRLLRECHPDRNATKEAQSRFEDIKLAYAVLGDTRGKKREYDKATSRVDP